MAEAAAQPRYTVAEYLALEEAAEDKSEFLAGEIFAMADATYEHNAIVSRTFIELGRRLADRECEPLGSDQRIYTPATGLYTYADLLVVCGPKFADERQMEITNPRVIIEVLSTSTEAYDRGRKFDHYRTFESLTEYVLMAQDRPSIEVRQRTAREQWQMRFYTGLESILQLETLSLEIPLATIYRGVLSASRVN